MAATAILDFMKERTHRLALMNHPRPYPIFTDLKFLVQFHKTSNKFSKPKTNLNHKIFQNIYKILQTMSEFIIKYININNNLSRYITNK